MTRIKIISNPYVKKISYSRFDESTASWIPIDIIKNSNSKLISNDLTAGFFSFKVKEIVDNIISEYDDGNPPIFIEFEGTADEYSELKSLCNDSYYVDKVVVEKSALYLENARDILPDIIEIFSELKPIINDSIGEEKIESDLKRFSDAADDTIPICVIGNYSSGKSTFINALIGKEILPSGANPVTAKVFKISQSVDENTASITVFFANKPIEIEFNENGFSFSETTENNALTEKISNDVSNIEGKKMTELISLVLSTINDFSSDSEYDPIGNMIEVKVAFNSTITENSKTPFMIFDTPGSNSASNVKHLEILKEAMKGMSNGIPVFVSEYNKLDTTDNEDLFNIIKDIDNLDSRFTMIVVNKADIPGLPSKGFSKADEEKTLRLFIPKNLYSGGIYFVSSVMGLGSKLNGIFANENCTETYDGEKDKYINPSDKYYKTLYRYNIMPEQLKHHAVSVSLDCTNIILANSGLYCIEKDIDAFAKKYSSYDKCMQSQMFLNSILEKTTNEIQNKKTEAEKHKADSIDLFEKHKAELINKLDADGEELFNKSIEEYPSFMDDAYFKCQSRYESAELNETLFSIKEKLKDEKEYENLKFDKSSSQKLLVSNLFENSKNIFKEKFDKEAFKRLGETFVENKKNAEEDSVALRETRKEIYEEASKELLKSIMMSYQEATDNIQQIINEYSIRYWKNKTKLAREILLNTVSGSRGINEEEQAELSKIILEYPEITLFDNKAQEIFTIENFRKKLVFDDTVKLKLEKLAYVYNKEVVLFFDDVRDSASNDHSSGFLSWLDTLLEKLKDNVAEYNQILKDEQLLIDMLNESIQKLEEKMKKLTDGSEAIKEMMLWK